MALRNQVLQDKIAYIKSRYDCLTYASRVLGWPVHKDGDRYLSLAPGSTNTTALIVHVDSWHDFKTGWGGDVIDLCAMARHNGDKGAAIRELGEGFDTDKFTDWDASDWLAKTQELGRKIQYWHDNLRPEDIEYLHSRKISDDTIERLKLGFDKYTFTLTIPYFKNGYVAYWAGRDRLVEPPQFLQDDESSYHVNPEWLQWQEKSKSRSKYHKASLDGYNENIPWGLHTLAPEFRNSMNKKLSESFSRAPDTLCILEGAFDVMSFEQEGFICLSPLGGYFNKKVNQLVIDTAKQFKSVFICFDSDGAGSGFNMRMAKMMFANRIPFMIGRLPRGVKDVSDYYTAGGSLIDLVNEAQDGIAALASAIRDKSEFKAFIYQAARFVDKPDLQQLFAYIDTFRHFDPEWLNAVMKECMKAPSEKIIVDEITRKYLVKYIESVGFYIYDRSGVWKSYSDNAVKNIIAGTLGIYANGSRLNTILGFLKAHTTTREFFNKQPLVNFPNGVLNLETGELHEHSPSYMTNTQMSYNYNPEATCPKWDKFTAEIMEGNPEKIKLLHEAFGYVLFPDLCLQKCFIFYGEGANGKSVAINVMTKLFGEENCSAVPMSLLASPFDPIRLLNSWVNFMTETDTNIKDAEARFKAIVVGDRISAAYKGKDAIEFEPRSVQIMATNNFFKTSDTSRGFMRRIMFIGFNRTFEGRNANKNLTQELCEELPGIFNRVYEAYRRLRSNMEFTQTRENQELLEDFIQIMDPVEAFVQEDAAYLTGEISSNTIYSRYLEWCKNTSHVPQSRQKFTRSFKTVLQKKLPNVKINRDRAGYIYEFPV